MYQCFVLFVISLMFIIGIAIDAKELALDMIIGMYFKYQVPPI